MQLYSDPLCPQCHRVRIVLAEKETQAHCVSTDDPQHQEDLMTLNPEGTTPTFIDRGLTLTYPVVIMKYLDDRFPHPPLMPVDPMGKAQARVLLHLIDNRLYDQLPSLRSRSTKTVDAARETMTDFLLMMTADLRKRGEKSFLYGDNFTLLDASMAPILWRLKCCYQIDLEKHQSLWKYAKMLYNRVSFPRALSPAEREMHTDIPK